MDEFPLVLADRVHAEAAKVVRGGTQADGRGHVRRARLELPGDLVPLRPAEMDLADHLPPARNGGIDSSSSRRAHRAPEPVGPSILWPENA